MTWRCSGLWGFDNNTRKMAAAQKRIETLEDLMATELDMEDLLGAGVEG